MKQKRRFKTKNELLGTQHTANLPYGEPVGSHQGLINTELWWTDDMCTPTPHPYSGLDLKIKVTPQESRMVQEKAFALGYLWSDGGKEVRHVGIKGDDPDYIFFPPSKSMQRTDEHYVFYANKGIELTPQQFLEGHLPSVDSDFDSDWHRSAAWAAGIGDVVWGVGAKKTDAYIDSTRTLHAIDDGQEYRTDILEAHKYNLMSEEDFKAKYPGKLKFKEWEITASGNCVKVGCETLLKADLDSFLMVWELMEKYEVDRGLGFHFINDHKKELGL